MRLTHYSVRHFRCITELDTSFQPSLNIIIGGNAQGKTSLLESICFLAWSRSPRTKNERELIQYHQEWFVLKGELREEGKERYKTIETKWNKGNKKVFVDGVALDKISELLGHIYIIFLGSDFASVVREGGGARRRFLDIQISQRDKEYLFALQGYQRALRQRNELLRKEKVSSAEFSVWELQLAQFGSVLIEKRRQFVEDISPYTREIHSKIEPSEALEIQYVPSVPAEQLLATLESTRGSDVQKGQTQKGPHRDDIMIKINGYPVRTTASQGQQKTCAFSLLISELYVNLNRKKALPILLADELFSDLDGKRMKKFIGAIPESVQCLITVVDNNLIRYLNLDCTLYRIRKGQLETA